MAHGMELEPAASEAANECWPVKASSETAALKLARAKLKQPDIQNAIEAIYELHGFSMTDMVKLQIDHAKGEITKQVVTKDGDVVDVKLPASYKALSDMMTAVGMVPAKTVNVRNENINYTATPQSVSDPIDVTPRDFHE